MAAQALATSNFELARARRVVDSFYPSSKIPDDIDEDFRGYEQSAPQQTRSQARVDMNYYVVNEIPASVTARIKRWRND